MPDFPRGVGAGSFVWGDPGASGDVSDVVPVPSAWSTSARWRSASSWRRARSSCSCRKVLSRRNSSINCSCTAGCDGTCCGASGGTSLLVDGVTVGTSVSRNSTDHDVSCFAPANVPRRNLARTAFSLIPSRCAASYTGMPVCGTSVCDGASSGMSLMPAMMITDQGRASYPICRCTIAAIGQNPECSGI